MQNHSITVSVLIDAQADKTIDLPQPWDEVADWYVKWDKIHLFFKDGTTHEAELDTDIVDAIEWKRPRDTEIYAVQDGETNWSEPIG